MNAFESPEFLQWQELETLRAEIAADDAARAIAGIQADRKRRRKFREDNSAAPRESIPYRIRPSHNSSGWDGPTDRI